MKKNARNSVVVFTLIGIIIAATPASAFNWPQEAVTVASFATPFGHLRANSISGSLLFAAPASVYSSDSGIILAIANDPDDGADRFYSTLGNIVIIRHSDDLLTVYSNLAETTIAAGSATAALEIEGGTTLGRSGKSAWKRTAEGSSGTTGLEFQVIDIFNGRMINPRILMPRLEGDPLYRVYGISAESRGTVYRIGEVGAFPAGVYSLYHDYDPLRIPYNTALSVNGTEIEIITLNMLVQRDGRLSVRGNLRTYDSSQLYVPPAVASGATRVLLGEAPLFRGRNTIRVTVTNINGLEDTSAVYVVENY